MKIQSLAIIFIIIILPISLVLTSYTHNRVSTINMQTRYDSKLNDATYDALKAYQLNSFNGTDTSVYTNAKIRDIKASANTFFNSMSSAFGELGYTKTTLQNYVPALVYTMYDGYYIYSPYENTWDSETQSKIGGSQTSFSNGETLYGLKPYVYYSCRYRQDDNNDVTITYSLDNYIQIQGRIRGKTVSKYGYLLDNSLQITGDDTNYTVTYKGVEIYIENGNLLCENVYINGENTPRYLPYIKKNGTKYYLDEDDGTGRGKITRVQNAYAFSVVKGKVMPQIGFNQNDIIQNKSAKEYYKEAYDLYQFIEGNQFLKNLSISDIVGENGEHDYANRVNDENSPYHTTGNIFNFDNIESKDSTFNNHKMEVIKHSIERNLSIAISNFNEYSGITFQMPKLRETDWDKIMNNISIISFLQGINIGGKIYNGYAIVTNTKNEDIVMEDSIYIRKSNGSTHRFHRVTEEGLNGNNAIGIYNVNMERRTTEDRNGTTLYYFPVNGTLSYDSIITQNKIKKNFNESISEYVSNLGDTDLKRIYYTALGRERYGLYRPKLEIPK